MCAHAVSVAVEEIEGVESVRVMLEEGLGEIVLEPENTVDPAVFLELVEDNGFTPGEMDVTVTGQLQEEAGRHLILVTGTELVYELIQETVSLPAGALPGQTIIVRARVVNAASDTGTRDRLRLIEIRSRADPSRPVDEDP